MTLRTLQDHALNFPQDIYGKIRDECLRCCRFSCHLLRYEEMILENEGERREEDEREDEKRRERVRERKDWRNRYYFHRRSESGDACDIHSVSMEAMLKHALQIRTNAIAILRSPPNSQDGKKTFSLLFFTEFLCFLRNLPSLPFFYRNLMEAQRLSHTHVSLKVYSPP